MTARFVVAYSASGWHVVDRDHEHEPVAHAKTEAEARRLAREWNRYNGPPVPGLSSMLTFNRRRRR